MSKHAAISPGEAADRLAIRELVEAYAYCALSLRPNSTPRALARLRPSSVRARISSHSHSARPPNTVSINRPWAVVVSAQASARDRNPAPALPIASRVLSRSRVGVHPVLPRTAEASQLQLPRPGPDGQPNESSQLGTCARYARRQDYCLFFPSTCPCVATPPFTSRPSRRQAPPRRPGRRRPSPRPVTTKCCGVWRPCRRDIRACRRGAPACGAWLCRWS